MSAKVASVGLVLRPQGFLAGIRNARGQFIKDVGAMKASASTLGAAIEQQAKTTRAAALAMSSLGKAPTQSGIFGWLKSVVSKTREAARNVREAFMTAFSAAAVGGGGGTAGGGGPLGAGALIAFDSLKRLASFARDTMRDVNATHESAMQLSVNARKGGGAYESPAGLEAQAYATAANVKGTTADEALGAMSAFVTLTGDLKTAQSSVETFAIASKASGADMKDVAEATASISKQFGIVDPKQIQDVLGAMIYQGKEGAIMLPEMARGLQKIAAAGAAFGVSKDTAGVRKLGGLVQMARGGTGSPEQAFTAVEAVFRGLTEKGKELKAQHVQVYEGKGAAKHTRSIDDILIDVVSKAGGKNIEKKNAAIAEIFGSEGMRAISPMVGIYQTAFANAKGAGGGAATDKERVAAGVAALREQLDSLTHAAGTWGDVQDDAAKMQEASSAKMTAVWEQFKGKLAGAVMPALGRLASKLEDGDAGVDEFATTVEMAVEALGGLVDFLKSAGLVKEKTSFEKAITQQKKAADLEEQMHVARTEEVEAMEHGDTTAEAAAKKKADRYQGEAYAARKEEERLVVKSAGVDGEQTPLETLQRQFPELLGAAPTRVEGGGRLDAKFREQYLEKQRAAGGAAPTGAWAAGSPAATPGLPTKVQIDGAVKLPPGPLRVHITGDDTKRGAGASAPVPGATPRG